MDMIIAMYIQHAKIKFWDLDLLYSQSYFEIIENTYLQSLSIIWRDVPAVGRNNPVDFWPQKFYRLVKKLSKYV